MPQRRTSIKDLRKSRQLHQHNLGIRADLKRATKNFMTSLKGDQKAGSQDLLKLLFKKIDKAAKRNVLHKNTAARRKSYFSRLITAKK